MLTKQTCITLTLNIVFDKVDMLENHSYFMLVFIKLYLYFAFQKLYLYFIVHIKQLFLTFQSILTAHIVRRL